MSTETQLRMWHPALDAYHCGYRMLRILARREAYAAPLSLLYILDFFLLYPFLLYRSSMPEKVRRSFYRLKLPRQDDYFVQLPSSTTLFRDLEVFQKTAASNLAAKNIFSRDAYLNQIAALQIETIPAALQQKVYADNDRDSALLSFLVSEFGAVPIDGPKGLTSLTGLSRK